MLDEIREHLGHVETRERLVFEDRRHFVHERIRQTRRQTTERRSFHQRFTEPHVDAAFDLPAHECWIERAPDVVTNPYARHREPTGVGIDFHFDDGRGI